MITEEDVAREVHQLRSKFLGFFCTTGKLCSEPLCVSVSVSIICCLQVKKKGMKHYTTESTRKTEEPYVQHWEGPVD